MIEDLIMKAMKKIICENRYCVYQKDGFCFFEIIEIDNRGNCETCVYIDIKDLEKIKEQQLNKLLLSE
jgi:hypothetical protein